MTRKIIDICEFGLHVICIKTEDKYNPYRVYHVYWENGTNHRKMLKKYADFTSVIEYVASYYRAADIMTEFQRKGII